MAAVSALDAMNSAATLSNREFMGQEHGALTGSSSQQRTKGGRGGGQGLYATARTAASVPSCGGDIVICGKRLPRVEEVDGAYHRCTVMALGMKKCMAGSRRLLEETRA